ncbi:hypothetical protein [Clostridium tertium]|uniref:hypothetical protein n=1 Tax=Clostridium tertium TaxID=1559 RepID=UPI0023B2EBCF|nr:hypothetical protein [Clostridium tertium]
MTKVFPLDCCRSCVNTFGKSKECMNCKDGSNWNELYDADPNCVHVLHSTMIGGGLRCKKCSGWICW